MVRQCFLETPGSFAAAPMDTEIKKESTTKAKARRGPQKASCPCRFGIANERPRQTKVGDLDVPLIVQVAICWFDIPMDHDSRMRFDQTINTLQNQRDSFCVRKRSTFRNNVFERLAGHQLNRHHPPGFIRRLEHPAHATFSKHLDQSVAANGSLSFFRY